MTQAETNVKTIFVTSMFGTSYKNRTHVYWFGISYVTTTPMRCLERVVGIEPTS